MKVSEVIDGIVIRGVTYVAKHRYETPDRYRVTALKDDCKFSFVTMCDTKTQQLPGILKDELKREIASLKSQEAEVKYELKACQKWMKVLL
jgi:hypothetical protein